MKNPLVDLNSDRLLQMIGLQTRRSVAATLLPSLGMFGVGLLTGAGLGLLFAPRKGSEMRRELGTKISDASHRVADTVTDASHRVADTATKVARKLKRTATEVGHEVGDEITAAIDEARDSSLYGSNGAVARS